ncbi:MAG: hypothetical protein GY804_14630 [Alphaproteobacteria bacterium]|nr:hypothetical protein [Alphaproteobacteria bacterium]
MINIPAKDRNESVDKLERELTKAYAEYAKLKKATISVSKRLDNAIEKIKQLT